MMVATISHKDISCFTSQSAITVFLEVRVTISPQSFTCEHVTADYTAKKTSLDRHDFPLMTVLCFPILQVTVQGRMHLRMKMRRQQT